MRFWLEIAAGFLSYVLIGWAFVLLYLARQWFLLATDVTFAYDWSREGGVCHPNFKLLNRSKSRTYLLAGIAYSNGTDHLTWFDNRSLMGKELKPGALAEFQEVAAVKNASSISECMEMKVRLRLQTGQVVWLNDKARTRLAFNQVQRVVIAFRETLDQWATMLK
jgi:hypothetical protein